MVTGISTKSYESVAGGLAGELNKSESALLEYMSKPGEQKNEAEMEKLKIKYQKDQRAMTLFSELMRNMHEMLMNLIRSLKLG